MRRLMLVALGAVMIAAPLASGGTPEGCVAQHLEGSPFDRTCTYNASVPGNIVAAGVWTVEVWWSGRCNVGAPDWARASRDGDNQIAGGGSWEGSIAAGSCARATAERPGTIVVIGEVRPAAGGPPPNPVPSDVPTAVPSDVPTALPSDVPTALPSP